MCDRSLPFWERLEVLTAPNRERSRTEEYRDGEPPEDETCWTHQRALAHA